MNPGVQGGSKIGRRPKGKRQEKGGRGAGGGGSKPPEPPKAAEKIIIASRARTSGSRGRPDTALEACKVPR